MLCYAPFVHATSQVRYRRSQAVDAHTIYDAEAVDHQLPLVKREWVERGGDIRTDPSLAAHRFPINVNNVVPFSTPPNRRIIYTLSIIHFQFSSLFNGARRPCAKERRKLDLSCASVATDRNCARELSFLLFVRYVAVAKGVRFYRDEQQASPVPVSVDAHNPTANVLELMLPVDLCTGSYIPWRPRLICTLSKRRLVCLRATNCTICLTRKLGGLLAFPGQILVQGRRPHSEPSCLRSRHKPPREAGSRRPRRFVIATNTT